MRLMNKACADAVRVSNALAELALLVARRVLAALGHEQHGSDGRERRHVPVAEDGNLGTDDASIPEANATIPGQEKA